MKLLTIAVGALLTNCYVLMPDGAEECAVIDAGGEGERIVGELARRKLAPKYVLSTHGHADHTGGVHEVVASAGGQFAIGAADRDMALAPPEWLTAMLPGFKIPPEPSLPLKGGEVLQVGDIAIEVVATPGHTQGSVCYRAGDIVLSGDTLFRGSIGRYDLPGGDGALEVASIREKLLTLDDAVQVYPGHGPATTIGHERRSNPYLQP